MATKQKTLVTKQKIALPQRTNIKIVYDELKEIMGKQRITTASLTTIAINAMQIVERLRIDGSERKQIVIDVIKLIIIESPLTDDERSLLNSITNLVLPSIIDGIILASKSELALNIKKKVFWCC